MLSKFSVKKPYTVVVAIVLVIILGFVSYTHMSVDLIPSFNLPYAVISTSYRGASPEEVEQTVTNPLEQGMASLSNVKNVSSVSSENVSMVILEFNEDTNMDGAIIEMRERLDLLTPYFPDEVGSPTILKLNPDMMPIVSMAVSVDGKEDAEAAQYIESKIIPEIESVEGVASVSSSGLIENMADVTITQEKLDSFNETLQQSYREGAEKELREVAREQVKEQIDLQLDQQLGILKSQGMTAEQAERVIAPSRVNLYSQIDAKVDAIVKPQLDNLSIPTVDVTSEMLAGVLQGQNISLPSGTVEDSQGVSALVRVGDKIEDLDALKALPVMHLPNYGDVTLADVAEITTRDNTDTMYSRVNGNYAVILSLQKQPDYSTADVSNNVQDKLNQINAEYTDVRFDTLMDQGEYVNLMISTILQNLLFGGALAILILYLFLRKIRPTIIVGASILISVVTAFVLMYFSGVTLNMISMGGLALGVGMLVDNSIVVIENIVRMRSEGMSGKEAAIQGAKEVTGAITASTLTTIIVFVPIAFTEGLTRQLFTDMALTIAFSLIASLVVALTLVPAAAGAMMRSGFRTKPTFVDKLAERYVKLLDKSLRYKWATIGLAVLLLVGSIFAAFTSGTELFPSMDSGSISVSVDFPDSYTQKDEFFALDELSYKIRSADDIEMVGIVSGGSEAGASSMMMGSGTTIYVQLKDKRSHSTDQVIEQIRSKTEGLDYEIKVQGSNSDMSAMTGGQIVVDVYGRDLEELRSAAEQVANTIANVDGATEVDNGLGKVSSELHIAVDRSLAITHGLTTAQIYQAVSEQTASDKSVTTVTDNGLDYSIYVKDSRDSEVKEEDVENIPLSSSTGNSVTVGDVASVSRQDGFSSISHDGQERTVSVTASLKNGYNVGDVNDKISKQLDSLELPSGCRYELGGESESIKNTFSDLFLMLALAVVFIYLVMVAQFQSLLSPFIVMFTIPLAFTGGFLALLIARMPVSAVALIGLVLLVGVVVNNGIVFVDYTNQQMKAGCTKHEALLKAGRNRIRPILMTALTTILALCTMAFDPRSGAEMLRPMAVTTIGGLAYATILTLFLVPAMYDLLRRGPRKKKEVQELRDEG